MRPEGIHGHDAQVRQEEAQAALFAAAVDRDELRRGAEELGVDFDEHLAFVIAAIEEHAADLGLAAPRPPERPRQLLLVLRFPPSSGSGLALVGRIPIVIVSLAILLSCARPALRLAGAVRRRWRSPRRVRGDPAGRLVDRLGQRRVLIPLALANARAVLGGLAPAARAVGLVVLAALVAGATIPPVSASIRARCGPIITGGEDVGDRVRAGVASCRRASTSPVRCSRAPRRRWLTRRGAGLTAAVLR